METAEEYGDAASNQESNCTFLLENCRQQPGCHRWVPPFEVGPQDLHLAGGLTAVGAALPRKLEVWRAVEAGSRWLAYQWVEDAAVHPFEVEAGWTESAMRVSSVRHWHPWGAP